MAEIPNLRLSLTNSAENVLVVRQALTGAAACVALDAIETNDVNTAVTEACNNVVMHAYEGQEGPLEVDLYAVERAIVVVVRDHGRGMRSGEFADTDADAAMTAMGIPVIEALTDDVRFAESAGGGTEVRMRFDTPNATALEPLAGDAWDAARSAPGDAAGDVPGEFAGAVELRADSVELRLAPVAIARAVLPRVLSVLAARAHFSTRRIGDVRLIADALAGNTGDSVSGTHLDVAVAVAPRNLELRIGLLGGEMLELSLVDVRAGSR
jgi:serine/threonine-protein kinase RsbW